MRCLKICTCRTDVHIVTIGPSPSDNAFCSAAQRVYGVGIKHILCRWHIDRYACISPGIRTVITLLIYRAWKNHLKGVKSESQVEVYQMLSLLESEPDIAVFKERVIQFLNCWKDKKPAFIRYLEQYYFNRPGMFLLNVLIDVWH